MYNFNENFGTNIVDLYQDPEYDPFKETNKIQLYKPLVTSILYSNNIDIDEFECINSDVFNTVIIPKSFYEYIIPTINRLKKIC